MAKAEPGVVRPPPPSQVGERRGPRRGRHAPRSRLRRRGQGGRCCEVGEAEAAPRGSVAAANVLTDEGFPLLRGSAVPPLAIADCWVWIMIARLLLGDLRSGSSAPVKTKAHSAMRVLGGLPPPALQLQAAGIVQRAQTSLPPVAPVLAPVPATPLSPFESRRRSAAAVARVVVRVRCLAPLLPPWVAQPMALRRLPRLPRCHGWVDKLTSWLDGYSLPVLRALMHIQMCYQRFERGE